MNTRWITSSAAAIAFVAFGTVGLADASMSPAVHFDTPSIQRVDCAVGFHVGPAGACIVGTEEEHHDQVIERRDADEGCETKTVRRSDDMGNSETHTKNKLRLKLRMERAD